MHRSTVPGSSRTLALGAIVLTTALWGLSYPLTKDLVSIYPPGQLAVLRLAIALVVMLPILLAQGKRPVLSRLSVLLGLTGVAMFQMLQNSGMQSVSAGASVVVLYGGIVILSSLLGWRVLGETCSPMMLGALAISAVGVGLVALTVSGDSDAGLPVVGVLLIIAAAGAWAVYTVIGRRAEDVDVLALNAGALLVGMIGIVPLAVREQRPAWETIAVGSDLLALVTLGAVVTAGSYFFWSYSLRHLRVIEASVLSSAEPVFGLAFAWLLLGETVSWYEAVGATAIVGGCLLLVGEQEWPRPMTLGRDRAPCPVPGVQCPVSE
ncbi:MAG: DMT family transporter [Thermomicrobiales bacterium]|nr:DMT family transporter [Thermomicrobiales bacterium]